MAGGGARALIGLMALAGPAVALGFALHALTRPATWTPSLRVQAQDREVQARQPELVVLGSSYAQTDTDPARLAEGLGEPELRISVLSTPGAPSAVWYAALAERVYKNGARPRLVVLVANMGTLLQGRLPPGVERHLFEQTAALDPAAAAKAGVASPAEPLRYAQAQRARLRDGVVALFRGGPVGVWLGTDGDAAVTAASARVFAAQQAGGAAAQARLLPVVEAGDDDPDANFRASVEDPEASFLPEIVALAQANGASVAVCLPPTAAGNAVGQRSTPEGEAAALAWARAHGIGWVDLRDESYPTGHFRDGRHMNTRGAAVFSLAAGKALAALGALGERIRPPDPPAQARRLAPPTPIRFPARRAVATGCQRTVLLDPLPPIDAASLYTAGFAVPSPLRATLAGAALEPARRREDVVAGCGGYWSYAPGRLQASARQATDPAPELTLADELPLHDGGRPAAWWVYPGGGAEWAWAEAPLAGPAQVEVELRAVGPGAGGFRLRSGEREAALLPGAEGRWTGALPVQGAGGLVVQLLADADAPYALVDRLGLVGEDRVLAVVRRAEGRRVSALSARTTWSDPPPPAAGELVAEAGPRGRFRVPHGDRAACLPYEVVEDQTALPGRVAERPSPYRAALADTQLVGQDVWFRASDGRPVAGNEARYRLRYRADRRCGAAAWLLPGDTLRSELGPRERAGLLGPPRRLHLQGTAVATPDASHAVRVRVRRGDTLLAEGLAPLPDIEAGWTLALPAPADTREAAAALTVELHLPPDAPPLVLDPQLGDEPVADEPIDPDAP